MLQLLYVFIGGGLGSICRYGISVFFAQYKTAFPYATLVANILSCIILGYFIGSALKTELPSSTKLLIMTGFCGGFSTFSTFSAETFKFFENGNYGTAFLYIGASVFLCLCCIFIGMKMS